MNGRKKLEATKPKRADFPNQVEFEEAYGYWMTHQGRILAMTTSKAKPAQILGIINNPQTADDDVQIRQDRLDEPLYSRPSKKGEINLKTLYNKDGEFDYEQVKNVAARIGSGELKSTRLNTREEQGRIAGGRRNVEASVIAGTEARTNPADARGGGQTRKEKLLNNSQVESRLEKYAKNEGVWFDYNTFVNNHKYLASGQEAHVYEDDDADFAVKAVDYDFGNYGISPLSFIDNRISLFNYLFPATKYELVGFTRDNDGRFRFILRQPFVVGETPHPSQRKAYIKRVLGANSELHPNNTQTPIITSGIYISKIYCKAKTEMFL